MPKRRLQNSDFIMGFDFGMRRIGVAVGTRESELADPIHCFSAENGVPHWNNVLALITRWEVRALVVGLPVHMDGRVQSTTFGARRFANKLAAKARLPAFLVDERLTSAEARSVLMERKLNFDVDSYSAKLILEQWLRSSEDTWSQSN